MASVFKSPNAPKGTKYTILWFDENGQRRKKIGYTDKQESEKLGMRLESAARKIRNGDIDVSSERFANAERKLLKDHVADWRADLTNRGGTPKHADLSADRVRRLVAVMCGAKPDEVDGKRMTRRRVQASPGAGRAEDRIGPALDADERSGSRWHGDVPRFGPIARDMQPLPPGYPRVRTVGIQKRSTARESPGGTERVQRQGRSAA